MGISFRVPLPSWPSRLRPHIYRTPSFVRRAEWWHPQETCQQYKYSHKIIYNILKTYSKQDLQTE
jgi:hypothetical protein